MPRIVLLILNAVLLTTLAAHAQADRFYGEPIELKSNYIYFTSWKYVRQGSFAWRVEVAPEASEAEKNVGAWLKGDGNKPARFETFDMPRGVRLVAQKAEKRPYQPGQRPAHAYYNGKYMSWDTMAPCPDPEPFSTKDQILPGYNGHVTYAESPDGITWTFPPVGIYEYAGNKENSIVFRGDLNGSTRGFHGGSVFVDPSSEAERFKMIYLGIITDDEWNAFAAKYPDEVDTMARRRDVGGFRCVVGVFGAVSPDGIHWESLPEPLMVQHADTLNTCYYDVDREEYVAYVRGWQVNERVPNLDQYDQDNWIGVGRRSIARAVSKDFRHFSKPELVVTTGADMPPTHLYYTNCKTTLPGIPDNHVMFPWIWELENDGGSVWLLTSADGYTWSHIANGNVVEVGIPGQPDGGHVACSGMMVEYPDKTWGISFGGNPIPHKYPGRDFDQRKGLFPGVQGIGGIATWPKGRLVALQCDEEGEFATVAVMPRGNRIRLNATVKPTGYIKTEIAQLGKSAIEGRTFAQSDRIIGDGLELPVTWNGEDDLKHENQPVILRFQLRQASLYGVEFY
ncbi:MAG: hypothetical protein AMXMBFR84_05720 [Candidatus Hydrogenedentota bacterium]